MPTPVCVECRKEMIPEHNGTMFIEKASFGPYKIWMADKWKCRGCGKEILCGFGQNPLSEHYMDNFQEKLKEAQKNPHTIEEK